MPVSERPRSVALYRIPVTLMLLGLFMMALQAGQPLLGLAMLMTAATTTLGCARWNHARQGSVALSLRDQADRKLVSGRYGEARALYERALALSERELPPAAPELLLNYYSLAAVNSMLHDNARAGRYLEELLSGLGDRVPRPWSGHVAWLMRRVAHHHSLRGHHVEAERLCRRALELVGDAPGADDNSVRSLVDDLAWVMHHGGNYVEAERLFREALSIHEQFRDVALELAQRPRPGAKPGRSPYREPGPATASTTGGLDRAVAFSLLGLGWTRYERGDYGEAQRCFERARLIAKRLSNGTRGEAKGNGGLWLEVLRAVAAVAVTRGEYDEAEARYEQARHFNATDEGSIPDAALLVDMSWLARCRERWDEAEAMARQAQSKVDESSEEMATIATALHESMAELRRRQGRAREGQRHIGTAQELASRCLGVEHPRMASILAVAARLHVQRSEHPEAERCARRSLALLESGVGAEHPRSAEAYLGLGEVQLARGQWTQAEHSLGLALRRRERALGVEHPELVDILEAQQTLLRSMGREDEARPVADRLARLRACSEPPARTAGGDSIPAQP
ncbi:MAG: tetratricopeptide repeat protein [Myxococcota bacterium]